MRGKIQKEIERLFEGIENTKEIRDLKEEIVNNTLEKANESIRKGLSEKESIKNALSDIGTREELLMGLGFDREMKSADDKVKITSYISGALWLFTVAAFLFLQMKGYRLSYLLFIGAAGVQAVVSGFAVKGKMKAHLSGALWLFAVVIFLIGSHSGYRYSFLVFIITAGLQVLLEAVFVKSEE